MNSEMELKTLDDVKVWHFSGKCGMLQPWMFQDKGGALEVETWLIKFYGIIDPGNIVAIAFAEWHKSLQLLLLQERGFERLSDVTDALERLYQRSESERQSCDHFLTYKLNLAGVKPGPRRHGREEWLCSQCLVNVTTMEYCETCYREWRVYEDHTVEPE